jgi:hypothetical protein
MDIAEAVDGIRNHLENLIHEAQGQLETALPVVADVASKAASNPAFAALASAAHLGEAPEVLTTLADLITKWDTALGNAKAQGAAEARAAVAAAAQPTEAVVQPESVPAQ